MFVSPEIFHKFDAAPFSENLFRADLPNRINPIIVIQIVDQCNVLQWLAENRAIPENVKIIHK